MKIFRYQKKLALFLVTIIFRLLLSSTGNLLAGVSVIIPGEITVSGPRMILGDISTVAPDAKNDETLASLIEKIDLGESPSPGYPLTLRRRQLEQKIAAAGVPLSDVRWLIPDEIRISMDGQNTDQSLIKKILSEYLDRSEPYISGRYEILSLNSAAFPTLPPGKIEYRFTPIPSSNPAYLTGTIFFTINGREASRLRITAQIELLMPAIVAASDLPRGHTLSEADLSESWISFALAKGALTDTSQALGQILKISLRVGSPVRSKDLVENFLVKKGETVTIIAQSGGLKVTTTGQAKQDGALGQTISVINQDSKKTIYAKVIGPSKVEVIF